MPECSTCPSQICATSPSTTTDGCTTSEVQRKLFLVCEWCLSHFHDFDRVASSDSTLYRRKKLHDVELQPCTDSLATPLTDAGQTTDKQRWAKILDAEDSEEEVPVLSSHTILVLLIWWIVGKIWSTKIAGTFHASRHCKLLTEPLPCPCATDYGVNIPLYQANAISPQKYATPIVWVVLTFAYIVYSSLKVHREGTLHRKYGGWLVNAWIGVR